MAKEYERVRGDSGAYGWEDFPSDNTAINAQRLNHMDVGIDNNDTRISALDDTKASKEEVAPLIKEISFNESNGIFTVTRKNGSKFTIDTKLEKIAINFGYDPVTQQISLTLIDGTIQYIDLSALITQYEFMDTDTVSFFVDESGKVSAIVKEGSIEEKHLRPNYLAEIKVEVSKAEASKNAASASEANAKKSENAAKASQAAAKESEDNAAASEESAAESASTANTKASEAASSATNASNSATTATQKATAAETSATNAANSATTATNKANAASASENNAATSATNAESYAKQSQSYAVGTGSVRPNEATDSAKYYYEQAKSISEGLAGALMPMGTVAFANLPALANAESGWMYNISNQFATTSDFKEGSGSVIPAGANVYKTADGKWDVLAGTPVTGIKGGAESSYRKGNVNISPSNIFKTVSVDVAIILTTQWTDIMSGTELPTGTYIICVATESGGKDGLWSESYVGLMHWYGNSTNSGESDEILLHSSGHANNGRHIFLRTKRNSNGWLKLQIAFSIDTVSAINLSFNFIKIL